MKVSNQNRVEKHRENSSKMTNDGEIGKEKHETSLPLYQSAFHKIHADGIGVFFKLSLVFTPKLIFN